MRKKVLPETQPYPKSANGKSTWIFATMTTTAFFRRRRKRRRRRRRRRRMMLPMLIICWSSCTIISA